MTTTNDRSKTLLTVKEVAARLGVSVSTIYSLVAAGELPAHRIGVGRGTLRIRDTAIQSYLESNQVESKAFSNHTKERRQKRRQTLRHLKPK